MRTIEARALGRRGLPFLACLMLILTGLWVSGQGCAPMDQWSYEGRRENALVRQMEWAEEELEQGKFHSARTIFACVSRESAFPQLQERALFFSGLTTLLNKGGTEKFEYGRKSLVRATEISTGSDIGRISGYLATVFSDVVSRMKAGENSGRSWSRRSSASGFTASNWSGSWRSRTGVCCPGTRRSRR